MRSMGRDRSENFLNMIASWLREGETVELREGCMKVRYVDGRLHDLMLFSFTIYECTLLVLSDGARNWRGL